MAYSNDFFYIFYFWHRLLVGANLFMRMENESRQLHNRLLRTTDKQCAMSQVFTYEENRSVFWSLPKFMGITMFLHILHRAAAGRHALAARECDPLRCASVVRQHLQSTMFTSCWLVSFGACLTRDIWIVWEFVSTLLIANHKLILSSMSWRNAIDLWNGVCTISFATY